MNIHKFNSFIIKVLDIEDESKWLSSAKVNIFITALIPPIIGLIGSIIKVVIVDENQIFFIIDIFKDERFIDAMQLLTITCTIWVVFRLRRSILITTVRKRHLFTYIQEKCNLIDQSVQNVNTSLHMVEKTVTQFYYTWVILWTVFFIYYGCSLSFHIFDKVCFCSFDANKKFLIQNGFNNFFNYLSSTIMLILFIILNSVTISLKNKRNRNELVSSVMFIVFFGCIILFPTLYSFALYSLSYFKLQLFISFILGLYSAFAFVLVLGKLNTNLQIPRFIFYWLYIYALTQTFQFLFTAYSGLEYIYSCNNCRFVGPESHIYSCDSSMISKFTSYIAYSCNNYRYVDIESHTYSCDSSIISQFTGYLETFNTIFQYITLIGKIFLSLTFLWIAYESRLVYHVIHQRQAITDMPYKTTVFRKYIRDTD